MIAFLSLGTNLGDKEQNLLRAINEIEKRIGTIEAQSAFIVTDPWGFESHNSFLNAAVKVKTSLTPLALLDATQRIEKQMGRTQKSINRQYYDRIIDIDILLCFDDTTTYSENNRKQVFDEASSLHISTPRLTIPHPLMNDRNFVLIPLKEII